MPRVPLPVKYTTVLRRSNRAVCVFFFAAATLLPLRLTAGDWHYGPHAQCSDCHTQHNSENGEPGRTDKNPIPAPMLLKRGTAIELCLSCHDGSNPAAPDVVTPIGYLPDAAGGAFPNGGGTPTDIAHHLDNPTPEVPPGGSIAMVLTCTTCHDPHGNANYRNLRPDPTRSGLPDAIVNVHQAVTANGTNPAQVYAPSNLVYKGNISEWCGKCHPAITHPAPETDHPVDRTIFGSLLADYATWANVTLPRVPTDSPNDDTIPSQDDRVTCLSCHKAHGSNNYRGTIHADGITMDSTCQECHNQ